MVIPRIRNLRNLSRDVGKKAGEPDKLNQWFQKLTEAWKSNPADKATSAVKRWIFRPTADNPLPEGVSLEEMNKERNHFENAAFCKRHGLCFICRSSKHGVGDCPHKQATPGNEAKPAKAVNIDYDTDEDVECYVYETEEESSDEEQQVVELVEQPELCEPVGAEEEVSRLVNDLIGLPRALTVKVEGSEKELKSYQGVTEEPIYCFNQGTKEAELKVQHQELELSIQEDLAGNGNWNYQFRKIWLETESRKF